jgi:antitoxin PrlF
MSYQVTSKGQVTIPKKIREFLGIKPGTAVGFEPIADGRVAIAAAGGKIRKSRPSRFAALRGTATVKMTTREIMALTRGES